MIEMELEKKKMIAKLAKEAAKRLKRKEKQKLNDIILYNLNSIQYLIL